MREWQKPLTPEKIQWLQEQFARHAKIIEEIWGKPQRPWVRRVQ